MHGNVPSQPPLPCPSTTLVNSTRCMPRTRSRPPPPDGGRVQIGPRARFLAPLHSSTSRRPLFPRMSRRCRWWSYCLCHPCLCLASLSASPVINLSYYLAFSCTRIKVATSKAAVPTLCAPEPVWFQASGRRLPQATAAQSSTSRLLEWPYGKSRFREFTSSHPSPKDLLNLVAHSQPDVGIRDGGLLLLSVATSLQL